MSYLTILLHTLAILGLLIFGFIGPALLIFTRLFKWQLPSFKDLKEAFGRVQNEQSHSPLITLLPLSGSVCTFGALALLILPFWPLPEAKFMGPFELPFLLITIFCGLFLNYIAVWLSLQKGAAIFIADKLAQLLALAILLILIVAAPLILAPGSELDTIFTSQVNQTSWPAWNIWRTPIAALSFLWLLLQLTGAAKNGFKSSLPIKSPLLYMDFFERFLVKNCFFLTTFTLMLLFVMLFMGGAAEAFILAALPLKTPLLTLLINSLALFAKLFILALLLKFLGRNYVPQTIATDIRIIIKYLLPLNIGQIIMLILYRL